MVEYILILTIVAGMAALLTKQLVSRDPDDPGILVAKWHAVLKSVGDDIPDKHKQ